MVLARVATAVQGARWANDHRHSPARAAPPLLRPPGPRGGGVVVHMLSSEAVQRLVQPAFLLLLVLFFILVTVLLRWHRRGGAASRQPFAQPSVPPLEWTLAAMGETARRGRAGWASASTTRSNGNGGALPGPSRGQGRGRLRPGAGGGRGKERRPPVHEPCKGGGGAAVELDCSDGYGRVAVREGRSRMFKDGSPLVYAGNVAQVAGDPAAGDVVLVVDHRGNPIGWGLYNPCSMYRVRLLSNARDGDYRYPPDLGALVESRLRQATALRQTLGLPSPDTSVYRLIHGEGDRISGLVADVFNELVVAQSSALWVERHRPTIESALRRVFPGRPVLWQRSESRLAQDGWTSGEEGREVEGNEDHRRLPQLSTEEETKAGRTDAVAVWENGLRFWVVPGAQKTGFYCDQRSNRWMLRSLCTGRSVLDLYSFTGGFALNAAVGGARTVTAVDSSLPALQLLVQNAHLNGVSAVLCDRSPGREDFPDAGGRENPQHRIVVYKADVLKFLRAAQEARQMYDVLIVDPPKLCPHVGLLPVAKGMYMRINYEALRVVAPGGLMLSCTCSSAVACQEDFFVDLLRSAAVKADRRITILACSTAAADHPISPDFIEGRYLRAVLLHVT